MNKQEFKEVMEGLKSLYGDKIPDMNGFAREVWYECLSDMDFEKAKKAIINHIKSNKFPPTVADIREQYILIDKTQKGTVMDMRKIFNEMKSYYPNGHNDYNAEPLFFDILSSVDNKKRYKYANGIKDIVIDYVKKCERGICSMNMSFYECIKWAKNEYVEDCF